MAESGSRAVVLGAGIAGLLAARVLSERYGSVIVVERDALPDHPEQRKGVPQGRHLHQFLSRGVQVIGEMFPGLLAELDAAGAVVDDGGDLSRTYVRVFGYELTPAGRLTDPAALAAYQASRPFMEFHLRRRVGALDNVTILDEHDALGAVLSDGSVTGARVVNRRNGNETLLPAELVIDATGRAGHSANVLTSNGFGTPPEERVPSVLGYSSQLMRVPAGCIADRLAFVNEGVKAHGALLVAYEHDTWMLAIACPTAVGGPPRDVDEMLDVAGRLLPERIAAGLRKGEPLGAISVARTTSAVWRRYDRVPRHPAGLIVLGDALCQFNPLYGQGMTMAALQALELRHCLRDGGVDLPRRFYAAAARQIGPVWAVNRANDRPPSPEATRTWRQRFETWMQRAALQAATTDIAVTERILRVRGLIDPPDRLRDPALLLRILRTARPRHRHA
ncbi:FAD-binding protein [Mycolicibacterium sp. S2-37]|uniref:FAD-dependent oxidoreductase n=1 Tax=Mycolicibacterium sp. S2-37 TaxID=2810297 RepID=UPI001A953498|nr:FAD-binding protein [Mycolicibacterium sp. S2-37]MBO0680400.1 FAD-binding protein [Mycolicibacterium sp. S2-37]